MNYSGYKRLVARIRYGLKKRHKHFGRMADYSHLTYFSLLFVEGWQKTLYAKFGVVCLICSALYLLSDEEDMK